MIRVLDATFVTTATAKDGWPRGLQTEIAFVGRSNVGKSSMINALTHRNKLVRVSNTPGRTRALNFFEVTLEVGKRRTKVRLVDLPGYGFAKASKEERARWQAFIEEYLRERNDLAVVVQIIDAEVGPTDEDVKMLDFLQEMPPRVLVVATRLDRLGKAARKPRLDALRHALELPPGALFGFSSPEKIGVDEVWSALLGAR